MTDVAEITGEERDALYEQILGHLRDLDDLTMAFEKEEFNQAKRLGIEFGDELRLMEDLGWGRPPTANTVKLTMGPEQLYRVFTRLRSDVDGQRRGEERDEAETENESWKFRNRAKRVTEVCERMLNAVTGTPPPG